MLKKMIVTLLLLLSVPLGATAAVVNLPKTGQDLCYDPTPNVLTNTGIISCTGTGQDGETQLGVTWPPTRFTDNGDGTVKDNLTGLVWLKDTHCTAINPVAGSTWTAALTAANTLASGTCGLTDASVAGTWRLPNVNELESLVDLSQTGPPLAAGNPFINFNPGLPQYWSSTITTVFPQNAEGVDMFTSTLRGDVKTNLKFVWPVKGVATDVAKTGQTACWDVVGVPVACPAGADGALKSGVAWPVPRFVDNGDGTLTDKLTDLIWLKQADCFGNQPTQLAALTSANNLASGACALSDRSVKGNWRLPNRVEMRSLLNYDLPDGGAWLLSQGFLNPVGNPIGGWYWTSDSYPSLVDPLHPAARNIKWMVKTEGGTWTNDAVAVGFPTDPLLVLPVRGPLKIQPITFSAITKTFGDAPLDLSTVVTGGQSGNPVTFTTVSGPGTLGGVNNATLTMTGPGTIVVLASQAGNASFLPAPDTQVTINVTKALATVTLTPGSLAQTFDGTAKNVTATTTPAGKTVTFTYDGSATAPINAGSYAVVATINDVNFQGSATGTLIIAKATATVTLGSLTQTFTGTARNATATTVPAGKTVTFTYNGSATAPIQVGTYTVVGTISDPNYAGSATGTLTISNATASFLVTASAPGGNGSISCSSPVPSGGNSVCTATPNTGYHLFALTDNGTDKMTAVANNRYTITGVTASHVVTAAFARPDGIVNQASGKTIPDITDALAVLNIVNRGTPATDAEKSRCDVAPLGTDGRPLGDGTLDMYDVIGILRMSLGLL
jgi:hypothetical protein